MYPMNQNVRIFHKTGFTLLELLVVIAVIGILAAVVMASMSAAREKGRDATIMATISNMRSQFELYYTQHNTYQLACDNDPTIASAEASLREVVDAEDVSEVTCNTTTDQWLLASPLVWDSNYYFCSDSSGRSGKVEFLVGGGSFCVFAGGGN